MSQITKKPLLGSHPTLESMLFFQTEAAKHQHEMHEHNSYSVIIITEGMKVLHLEGKDHIVHKGQIVLINPGQLHGCEPYQDQPWAHNTFYVNIDLMQELAKELGYTGDPEFKYPVINDENIRDILIETHQCMRENENLDQETKVLSALSLLIEKYTYSKKSETDCVSLQSNVEERVEIYKDILSKNFSDNISLATLAQAGQVTRFQVIRDFQKVLNIKPGTYIKNLRLNYAKDLILSGISLSDAALRAGFSDQSHFSRTFRNAYGFPPKTFQIAARNNKWNISL